jgi:hypothetical protein
LAGADVHVTGMPGVDDALVLGRSGSAAAWLAARALSTGRPIPEAILVSANVVTGPDGEPLVAPIDGADDKLAVVRREWPNARLIVCTTDAAPGVERLEPGTAAGELERRVWGRAARADRVEASRLAAAARDCFLQHDYTAAASLYRELSNIADDDELCLEACLRLAAIEVHRGQTTTASEWFDRADAVPVPPTRKGPYVIERLAGMAGQAIDAFQPAQVREFLASKHAARAMEEDHPHPWERIQILGAWRRLYLLEGEPERAREAQHALLSSADEPERPRAFLDLAFTELRCGDFDAAAEALRAARVTLSSQATTYQLQSTAFLAWYAARLARRSGLSHGFDEVLAPAALDRLLAELQPAARWRIEAVRASDDVDALARLADRVTPFQRWYLGVFLLEVPETRDLARSILSTAAVDLSEMPELANARSGAGPDPEAVIQRFAAY